MRKALAVVLFLLAAVANAQPSIAPPGIGFLQDDAGFVRPVHGLAGNFLVGDPTASGAISSASSGSFSWVKTDSAVIVADLQGQAISAVAAPPGPALFAFANDGTPAFAYLLTARTVLQWNGVSILPVVADWAAIAADEVLSIAAPDPDHATLLIRRKDGVWNIRVLLASGAVDSATAIPAVTAPAFLFASGDVISSDDAGLVLNRADGSMIHIAARLPDKFRFQEMGDGWLEVRSGAKHRQLAVRVTKNREGSFVLPEVSR